MSDTFNVSIWAEPEQEEMKFICTEDATKVVKLGSSRNLKLILSNGENQRNKLNAAC